MPSNLTTACIDSSMRMPTKVRKIRTRDHRAVVEPDLARLVALITIIPDRSEVKTRCDNTRLSNEAFLSKSFETQAVALYDAS
jgi:hypothetical protein